MDQPATLIVAIAATFFVAGVVKGVTGMGLPTVAMGLLSTLMSPLAAATLLLAPSFITNVWQLVAGPRLLPITRRLWPMMVAIVVGTVAGSAMLAGGNTVLTTSALGAALILYAAYTLIAPPFHVPSRLESRLSPAIGMLTGILTGGTGVFVIPAVPYIQSLGFEQDELVQALGMSFTVSTIALGVGIAARGALPIGDLALSALAIGPALGGMMAGQAMRSRISPAAFRRAFLFCLLLLGLEMAVRPFF